MIHVAPFLLAGGVAGALIRESRRKQKRMTVITEESITKQLPDNQNTPVNSEILVTDDSAEITHQQRASLIALALSGSAYLVYPPFMIFSIPLLGYSTFYYLDTLRRTNPNYRKSALTIFEIASIVGSLLTGRLLLLSSLLAFSYSTRKWGLHAGNIASIGLNRALDPRFRKIWVLRDEAEIEINIPELRADDVAVLRAGDVIRLNGVILEGQAIIKQYSLTGLVQAIPKQEGDPVFSYTEVAAGDLHVKYK